MTAKVARIVGLPTSSVASTATVRERAAARARQTQVPDDVLDDDDRVVHEDADREDQREEGDAVERVAEEPEDEERERERHRHGEQHDARLAPAERQRHQQRDGEGREAPCASGARSTSPTTVSP